MKLIGLMMVALLGALAGCGQKPSFELVADQGQIGQGAKLTLYSNGGRLTMGPAPGWPRGLDEQVTGDTTPHPVEELQTGHMWSAHVPSKKLTLKFIFIGSAYICESCVGLQLPIQWTKQP